MSALGFLIRVELRSRWVSLVGLGLIVAVVTGVVLASAAGARRTASVLERFERSTNARDIAGIALTPEFTLDLDRTEVLREELAQIDGVSTVSRSFGYFVMPPGGQDLVLVGSPDGSYVDIDRPLIVAGRLPSQSGFDEVALNEMAAESLDLGVGDRLSVDSYTPETIASVFRSEGFPDGPDGPTLTFEVVGVVRTGEELSATIDVANPLAITSPAFVEQMEGRAGRSVLLVLMHAEPDTDIGAVQEVLTRNVGEEWESFAAGIDDSYAGEVGRSYRALAVGIAVFSLIAAAAGLLGVGQALSRQSLLGIPVDVVARGLGATRRERVLAICAPSLLAVGVGVGVGVLGAIAVSPVFPLSIARPAEVSPGVRIDVAVLLVGALVALSSFGAWSWLSARRIVFRSFERSSARSARVVGTLTSLGLRPPALVGVRMAAGRGRGPMAVPARSAMLGAAIGVAGVVGVAVFLATADDALDDPSRWGWAWTSSPEVQSQDPKATAEEMLDDDRIAAVAELRGATVLIGDETLYAYALDVAKGSMGLTIDEGRAPTAPQEVALGRRTLADLGLGIGDRVEMAGPGGDSAEFTVVGSHVPPLLDSADPGRGATLTVEGLDLVRSEAFSRYLVLSYDGGGGMAALESDLAEEYGLDFAFGRPEAPGQLQQLQGMRSILIALAVFLGGIGTVGLVHFLAVSVRRRRGQFGVLRALGFVRRQVVTSVSWQSVGATLVGVLIGVPVGVMVGRASWLLAVQEVGMADAVSTPWLAGVGIVVVALLGAAILAVGPGWYAARGEPAELLRAE